VSWLTDGSSKQRCCCFKRRRERLLLFYLFFSQTLSCFKLVFFPLSLSLSLSRLLSFSFPSISFSFLYVFFSFLCVFPPPVTGLESSIYRVKGRGGIPIAALSLHMGRGAFLPCYDAEGGGQWVWFAETAPDEVANGCGLQGRLRWLLIMRGSVHAGKK